MSTITEPNTADLLRQIDDLRKEVAELRDRTPEDKAATGSTPRAARPF